MKDEVKPFKKGKRSLHPSSLIPHPSSTLAVVGCSQLVTLGSATGGPRTGEAMRELAIIPDGMMLVRDGRIIRGSGERQASFRRRPGHCATVCTG